MYKNILIVAIATLLFSSRLCAQDLGTGFVLPTIPDNITEPAKRADYLALHYWDNLDMENQEIVESETTQRAFADFISILPYCERRSEAFAAMWQESYKYRDAFYHLLELTELYLYDVGSPLRNEEYYIEALEAIIGDSKISDLDKIAPSQQLDLLKKNRVGEMATDFQFVDKQGFEHSLSEYRTEYVLLIFASADCDDCRRMKRDIDANTRLWMMLRRGSLAIVAITISEDESAWLATSVPERWIEGWDKQQDLDRNSIYDLTTKPRLYLLDQNHKVLLKNTIPAQVEAYIINH